MSAKVFIDEHFREPIDLAAVARKACLSRYHFHRLFRRIYRRTPHEYLRRKRIDEALSMLAAGPCSIGEVCAGVGFESIGSFSMLFKKETGVAPAEFRERERVRRAEAARQPRLVIPFCFIGEVTAEKSNNGEGKVGRIA